MGVDGVDGSEQSTSRDNLPSDSEPRRNSQTDGRRNGHPTASVSSTSPSIQHSPDSPFPVPGINSRGFTGGIPVASLVRSNNLPESTRPYSHAPIALNHDEALLVHYYTEHLGRWLDCTDATRQFTLGIPEKVKKCPVLCHAVQSFAARHRKEHARAEAAYQRCIALLIDRLSENAASQDETLLCAIVILHFYEQLNGEDKTSPC